MLLVPVTHSEQTHFGDVHQRDIFRSFVRSRLRLTSSFNSCMCGSETNLSRFNPVPWLLLRIRHAFSSCCPLAIVANPQCQRCSVAKQRTYASLKCPDSAFGDGYIATILSMADSAFRHFQMLHQKSLPSDKSRWARVRTEISFF